MGIFDRMGKLIQSNVNALLDKADDPRKTVDSLIEEMRDQIRAGRREVVSALAAEKQLRKKVLELDEQLDKWQRRAELAVKAGDDALAREGLLHKKHLGQERDRQEALRAEQAASALKMKDQLEAAQAKLQELESKKGTIVARYEQARAGGGAEALGAKGTGPTPLEQFKRIEDGLDRAEAEADGMREARQVLQPGAGGGGMTADELEAKFAALEARAGGGGGAAPAADDVEDELRALRKKFRVGP
jgi:phage shock protein A